jgi:hypothetical protein
VGILLLCEVLFAVVPNHLKAIDLFFRKKDFKLLLHYQLLTNKRVFVDQIYQSHDKAVMIKFGINPKDLNQFRKIETLNFGSFYNDLNEQGVPFSIFFYNIPISEIRELIAEIPVKKISQRDLIQTLFVSKSWADSNSCSQSFASNVFAFSDELNQKSLGEIAWTCSAAAGSGAEKKGEDTIDMINPTNLSGIEISAFWSKSVKTYEAIKVLVPQLEPMMNQLGELLKTVHPKLKLNLICSAIGAQVVDAITPGGVIKKVVFLKNKIEALKKLMETLKGMSKLYEKYPDSKTLEKATQRVGACAI